MISYRNPRARWLGSPNFTPDRDGHDMSQPSWVVLHTMVGTADQANARFQDGDPNQPGGPASATYGVKLDGTILQWVDEKDAAWANGNTGTGGVGDNLDAISIEHEDAGDYNGPRTPALYAASAALVRDVCLRYDIPIDRQHVIGHRECTGNAPTACPDALDMDRIVRDAANPPAQPAPPATTAEGDPMVSEFTRPDGTQDTFELLAGAGGVVEHTHVDPATGKVLARLQLPGEWETIEMAGVWPATSPSELWMRGTALRDGRLWQANLSLQPGATWSLQGAVA